VASNTCKVLAPGDVPLHTWRAGGAHGRVVQVDPMKPRLKPHGTKRLKLKCGVLLLTSAFKLNLRRYIMLAKPTNGIGEVLQRFSDVVGRCRLTLSNPR